MRKGFTLTEVLVVIVILGILAAFLFPVFGSAKGGANKTVCVSNLHQLYVAMQLYRDDNGAYPPAQNQNALNSTYLGGTRLRCPAQTSSKVSTDYPLNGSAPVVIGDVAKTLRFKTEYEQCRETRQSDFPLIWDLNHASERSAATGQESFYLFAREGGQIQKVPSSAYVPIFTFTAKPICALELGFDNL